MPGIFGLLTIRDIDISQQLHRMAQALKPEAPGFSDLWVDQTQGIGLGRETLPLYLPQHQPIVGPRGMRLVVYGQACSDGSAESVTHGLAEDINLQLLGRYMKEGLTGLLALNGGISAAIWQPELRKLEIIPDRYGLRPAYYLWKNGQLAFASELKALVNLTGISKEISPEAAMEWLSMDVLMDDRTLVKDIRRIPFGSSLTYSDGQVCVQPCWPMEYQVTETARSTADYVDEFVELSRSAVAARLQPGRTSIALSGGLDSRYLLSVTRSAGYKPTAVTYGLAGSRDVNRAAAVSQKVEVEHQAILLREDYPAQDAGKVAYRCEGLHNALNCHGLAFLRNADPIVMLSNGVDQWLYATRSEFPALMHESDPVRAFFHNRNRYIRKPDWTTWFTDQWLKHAGNAVEDFYAAGMARYAHLAVDEQLDSYMMHYYANRSLSGLAMITQGMEFSEPFYDTRIAEFSLQAPARIRWGRILEKEGLRRLTPELAKMEGGPDYKPEKWAKAKSSLDYQWKRVLARMGVISQAERRPPSSTFTDMHRLLRLPANRAWLEGVLLSPRIIERDIYQPKTLRRIVDEHVRGIQNHTLALSTAITFELFLRQYID